MKPGQEYAPEVHTCFFCKVQRIRSELHTGCMFVRIGTQFYDNHFYACKDETWCKKQQALRGKKRNGTRRV